MNDQPPEDQVLPGLFFKLVMAFLVILLLRAVMSRAMARRKEN